VTNHCGLPHPAARDRRGFALITALVAIGIITVAVMASLTLVSTERRAVDDQQLQARALGIAQQGLDAYLRHPENPAFRPGRTVHLPPNDNDTAWVPVNVAAGDTAIIIPRLLHTSIVTTSDTMYVISSLGRHGGGRIAGTPAAQRAVAEIVTWTGAVMPVKAGWMSLSGLNKNGASGTLSGIDDSPSPCLPGGNLAGVMVPASPGYTGSTTPLSGNPPLDNTTLGTTPQTAAAYVAGLGIDWADWSQGLNLPNVWRTSDHGGSFPSFSDPNYYPVVYVNGDVPMLPSGRGLLIISGNMTMNGLTTWNGMVLVGGTVTANGNDNIEGSVISGLNLVTGAPAVAAGSIGNGTKTIVYNSCEVKKAMAGTHALVPRRGTWMDNWKTY
jgi:type II secretory pathway pseudopilin PulG